MNNEENKDIIIRAIEALHRRVLLSQKSDSEKDALKILLDSIERYYINKSEKIIQRNGMNNEKLAILQGFITDIIVKINDILNSEYDIYYFISDINKKLNDKEIEKIIVKNKSKKL